MLRMVASRRVEVAVSLAGLQVGWPHATGLGTIVVGAVVLGPDLAPCLRGDPGAQHQVSAYNARTPRNTVFLPPVPAIRSH